MNIVNCKNAKRVIITSENDSILPFTTLILSIPKEREEREVQAEYKNIRIDRQIPIIEIKK